MIPPGPWTPGETLDLDQLNAMRAEFLANKALKVDSRTGLKLQKFPWGQMLRRTFPEPIYGLLSGASSPYNFVEQVDLGGGWTTGKTSGIAYEVNDVASLGGTYQWIEPDRLGTWRFQAIRSSAGGGVSSVTTSPPNCFCSNVPDTLTLAFTLATNPFDFFQNSTLVYGPAPYPDVFTGTTWYAGPFTETLTGHQFFYAFSCTYRLWNLIFLPAPGSPLIAGDMFGWQSGSPGNTCQPFAMTNAFLESGGAFEGPSAVIVTG